MNDYLKEIARLTNENEALKAELRILKNETTEVERGFRVCALMKTFGLTTSEADLLLTLYDSNVPLNRSALMDKRNYGYDTSDPLAKTIDVRLSHIRRKLWRDIIQTNYNVGWLMTPESKATLKQQCPGL